MSVSKKKYFKILMSCAAVLSLAACGGGSSGRTSTSPTINPPPAPAPTPTPPPPSPEPDLSPDDFRTPEYNISYGLEAINSAEAYAEGVTGEGVTIGFLDFGFNLDFPDLNYSAASAGEDATFRSIYEAQIGMEAGTDLHGQAVAAVAAAIKNDIDTHGVAFGANVLAVDYFSGVNLDQFFSGGTLVNQSFGYQYLIENGARVVNKSIGFDEDDIIQNPPVVNQVYVLDSEINVVIGGGLLVASAGNNGDPEPSLSNIRTYQELDDLGLIENGPGAFLIVGAVDENLNIASFSDRAGNGPERNNFLVAPGVDVVAPFNDDLFFVSGTSFSAPHVSGTAALIFERWPFLTAREVADILLISATDLGAPGVDDIYGHGLLNAAAALSPQGNTVVTSATGVTSAVSGTAATTGNAFGDARAFRGALSTGSLIDGFGRDFQADLSSLVEVGRSELGLYARLKSRHNATGGLARVGQTVFSTYSFSDEDRLPIFARSGAAKEDLMPRPDIVFEFTGGNENFSWQFGSGQALGDRLGIASRSENALGLPSLSRAFQDPFATKAETYVASSMRIAPELQLTTAFAIAENKGQKDHLVTDLHNDTSITEFALGLLHNLDRLSVSYTLGVRREHKSLLGSRGAGGFDLVDHADTTWLTVASQWQIGDSWTLSGELTGGLTQAEGARSSLISDIGAIYTTSGAFRIAKDSLLTAGDTFGLTISQPLRAEHAPIQVTHIAGRAFDSGEILYENSRSTLTSSGREIALEGAYSLSEFAGWSWEAALTQRFSAGHIKGLNDTAVYFNMARSF